ncbi:phage portal protein [Marinobacter sp.]|uniref:anti-CBASS protein Acb1 family protein n=1 Tax=Marinobacter sp. TaxID=50741 RepID=UPI000C9288CF|nr:anti-CBASS Acb1 family protein [Marinobacter sp.]MAB53464.1 hypothetical protein [Marinobacter sp.]|tara:strand:- start:4183 stop:5409 length:1227 start_codon:yes stop_codon:yes gene_type:complete
MTDTLSEAQALAYANTLFADGLTSLNNKLANRRDPRRNNIITSAGRVGWEELRSIYRSGMGSKIIRLKSGIALNDSLQFFTETDRDFYNARLQKHVKRAAKFMLAFGRGLVVVHEPGADLSRPLSRDADLSKARYHTFSGDMVAVSSVNMDLASPDYYRPRLFNVRGTTIHPSRCVDFRYVEPVEHDAPQYQFGGISEFELIRNELVADQIVQRAAPSMLEKSSTIFYKLKGFKALLSDHKEDEAVAYFSELENLRSIYGAGIVDADDTIESITQALTNLADSDMITLRRLAMVTGLPLSWLVGEAARGLNSTGEGERQVLMQTIETLQSDFLQDPINQLLSLHGMDPVEFKDNQGERPTERMEYEVKVIQNALVLWQMGEDYGKYLERHGIVTPDAFDKMFGADDEA